MRASDLAIDPSGPSTAIITAQPRTRTMNSTHGRSRRVLWTVLALALGAGSVWLMTRMRNDDPSPAPVHVADDRDLPISPGRRDEAMVEVPRQAVVDAPRPDPAQDVETNDPAQQARPATEAELRGSDSRTASTRGRVVSPRTPAERQAFLELVVRPSYDSVPIPMLAKEQLDKLRDKLRADLSDADRREALARLDEYYRADMTYRLAKSEAFENYVLGAEDLAVPDPSVSPKASTIEHMGYGIPEPARAIFGDAGTVVVNARLGHAIYPQLGRAADARRAARQALQPFLR